MLAPVILPPTYNYIAAFLTLDCNLHCSYCINSFGDVAPGRRHLSADQWLAGLNRIVAPPDLPVTLQGGEPTLHPEFINVVNGIKTDLNIDLLTNLELDVERFISQVPPKRLRREAPYASIRVSYHPEVMDIEPLAAKVQRLLAEGYSVGIWGVLHPDWKEEVLRAGAYCTGLGIDFRTKEFLGEHAGTLYGEYRYIGACGGHTRKSVRCRTSELLIGPDGGIYRCHSDLYAGRRAVGHLLDPALEIVSVFRDCDWYGCCNPCDIKVKTNRFQSFGHTSVEIDFY